MSSGGSEISEFEELLNLNEVSDLGSFYEAESSLLKKTATEISPNVSHKQLIIFIQQGNLVKTARLLDIHLGAALAKHENQAELFFALLESAVVMLPVNLGCEFWIYLEGRHSFIAELAQGSNSIILLRTCRSFLATLNPELYKEESGRVLQFLAASKGFAHPSRLNKKGKIYSGESEPAISNEESNRQNEITPLNACQTLLNLPGLSREDTISFLDFLNRRTQDVTCSDAEVMESVEFDFHKWQWSDINSDSGYRLLAEQILIALSTIAPNSLDDSELQSCISKLTDNCKHILEPDHKLQLARVFSSDALWKKWKQAQCPYIDYETNLPVNGAKALGKAGEQTFFLGTKKVRTSLLSCIGNSRLTRLLQAKVTTKEYYAKSLTAEAESNSAEAANPGNSKSLRESMAFLASRRESWQQLLENQAAEPANEHAELQTLEAELLQAQAPIASSAIKRSPSVSQEPAHKRPRISYEDDTRYQDRQRGLQTTSRPLPY